MFGRKKKKGNDLPEKGEDSGKLAENASGPQRCHIEGLGDVWAALTGHDPRAIMPQVVATVLEAGGTRPCWQWKRSGREYVLMAWPEDQPVRAAVLLAGEEGGALKPASAFPLLQGLPADLRVELVHPRKEGLGADVAVNMIEGENPMWFFDPLYVRDQDDLTAGVTHTFWLGAAAFVIRKALLDEVAITAGAEYEEHALKWLEAHPDKGRLDVPPLKFVVKDRHFIMPGRNYCEYQLRARVEKVEDYTFEKMPLKAVYLSFPFEDRADLNLVLFASKMALRDYEPQPGEEIEAHAWFQGRIIDLEENPG